MSVRSFNINTEPHEAKVGDVSLFFLPEVAGSDFATAYARLRDVQKKLGTAGDRKPSSTKHAKGADLDPEVLGEVSEALRTFVHTFLVPGSRDAFNAMFLPDRILVELMEWIAELYGGGSGNPGAAGGTSTG